MTEDRRLLEALANVHPWSYSQEGLDDCCIFCGSRDIDYADDNVFYHEVDCVWLEACEYLEVDHGRQRHLRIRPEPPRAPQPTSPLDQAVSSIWLDVVRFQVNPLFVAQRHGFLL